MKLSGIVYCSILFAATSAMGQTKPGDVVVDVPFAFSVAGHQLSAGHYIVAAGDGFISLASAGQKTVFVPTHAADRANSDGSKLVFHQYGGTYFLSGVWVTGNLTGREIYRSRAERELASHQSEMQVAELHPAR